MRKCPTCRQIVPPDHLSVKAAAILRYMIAEAPKRGGYLFEGARPAYEAGTYHDAELSELLSAGLIAPHNDPAKGWVVLT